MPGLFTTNGIQTNMASTAPATDAGDFSEAIASIGTAIGEMKTGIDGMESGMERAFVKALVSDEVNNALYDAIASATYDAVGDAISDNNLGNQGMQKTPQENANPYGYSLSDLFNVTPKNDIEKMGDFLADSLDELGKTITSALDELSGGNQGASGETSGEKETVASNETADESKNQKSDELAGTVDNSGQKESSANPVKEVVSTIISKESDATGNPGSNAESSAGLSEKKRLNDLTLNMLSGVLPNFIGKGNVVFDKILDDELFVHLDDDTVNMLTDSMSSGFTKMPVPHVGPSGALTAATVAALAAIGLAGKKFYDWMKSTKETEQTIRDFTEANTKSNAEFKEGANDDMRDANERAIRSGAEVAIEGNKTFKNMAQKAVLEGNPALTLLGPIGILAGSIGTLAKKLGAKTSLEAAQERHERNEKELAVEIDRYKEKADLAAEFGVERTDVKGITRWEEEQKNRALESGVDVNDREKFIQFIRDELDRRKAESNPGLEGTVPNGQQVQQGPYGFNYDMMPERAQMGEPDVPTAVGSTVNRSPSPVNAGTGIMNQDILTAEQQFIQYKKFMFEGIRDALLLPEIQAMFSNTARMAGSAVNGELMGD